MLRGLQEPYECEVIMRHTVLRWWRHIKWNRRVVEDAVCRMLITAVTNYSIEKVNDLLMQDKILKTKTIQSHVYSWWYFLSVLLSCTWLSYDSLHLKLWELSGSWHAWKVLSTLCQWILHVLGVWGGFHMIQVMKTNKCMWKSANKMCL